MKNIILSFIFLIISQYSYALCNGELSVQFGGWSKHVITSQRDGGESWNEDHGMLGVSCNRWRVMHFQNSWDRETYSFTYETKGKEYFNDRIGVSWMIGGWSGYQDLVDDPGIIPIIVPKVEYRFTERFRVESLMAGVVYTLSFKYTLGEENPKKKFARPGKWSE